MTVGTHPQQFDRLLRAADSLNEPVFAQIGNSSYVPQRCRWERFVDQPTFLQAVKDADVVVTHAGVGSIVTALEQGRPVVAVPRLKRFGEHTDDHQLQIATQLAQAGRIIVLNDVADLHKAIEAARKIAPAKLGGSGRVMELIEGFLQTLEAGPTMSKL